MLKLLLAAAVLAPSADADRAARGFALASISARERLTAVREIEDDPAVAVRAALKACIDDWAARPEERVVELRQFYDVVVTAPLWERERPPAATWVEQLKRIRGIGALRSLRDGRRALRAQLAYTDALYAEPVDACGEVKAWRASGWGEQRPPQLARLHAIQVRARRHFRQREVALFRAGDTVKRRAGAVGRRAKEDIWLGIQPPDRGDYCDDVLIAIDSEEAFCG